MEKLQSLLSAERQKEFQAHVSGQEKETEIQHLRQQLTRLDADRLALSEQLRESRSEVRLKGEEIQRMKLELAEEHFQREHAKHQLVDHRAQLASSAKRLVTAPLLSTPPGLAPPTDAKTATHPSSASGAATSTQDKREDIFSQERDMVASDSARKPATLHSLSAMVTDLFSFPLCRCCGGANVRLIINFSQLRQTTNLTYVYHKY